MSGHSSQKGVSRHPTVKWAQRSDRLYLTVELPDAKDVKLKLEPEGRFYFSAKSGVDNVPYEIDITLFDKVNVDDSKSAIGLRNNVRYLIKKGETKWWNRLLKPEGKPPVFIKIDWDKWVDEDEEQSSKSGSDMDFGDLDLSRLNMGGPGGFDDEEDQDEDDDEDMQAESTSKGTSSNLDDSEMKT